MSRARKIKLTKRSKAALEGQLQRFKEKFGREPGAGDPVFFDPNADTPQQLNPDEMMASVVTAMHQAGTPPQIIYAYIRTGGMLVTESTKHVWLPEDLAEWEAAIDEYFAQQSEAK